MTDKDKKAVAVKKKAPAKKSLATTELKPAMSPVEQMLALKEMNLEVADMKEMLALQKEYDAMEAEKLFNIALANFKAEDILITRDKRVSFKNNDNSMTEYSHASLGNIVETAVPFMSKHGLSHRWKLDQSVVGVVKVTFILTHVAGHSEETPMQAGADASGKKNDIQRVSSTITYLERYTMLAGTGLAVLDQNDDDGRGAISSEAIVLLSDEQSNMIHSRITENDINMEFFKQWMHKAFVNVEEISDLPTSSFEMVMGKIDQTIAQMKKKAS